MNALVLSSLPNSAGIYLFKDSSDTILYIGKAKNLKKRVSSYFSKQKSDWKIDMLLAESASIAHISTGTETEALLLEAELVKKYQPKFNVLLKSGQPFLYLLLTHDEIPTLEIVRTKKKKGVYFGPFIHKQHTRNVYRYLLETFQLYRCNKKLKNGCLDYHIGRCIGTCLETFNEHDYNFKIELMLNALKGNRKQFLALLQTRIQQYNKERAFEKAKHLHAYIESLETIFETLKVKFSLTRYLPALVHTTASTELKTLYQEASSELKSLFNLSQDPETIDCFDISHFQSMALVGSCIRFKNGIPDKNNFRRFKIKTLTIQNDYAALYEIVARRYKDQKNLPDIVLIDGGKGQRNAVLPLLPSTLCISIAKREERIFSDLHPDGFVLDKKSVLGKLLISLRDYAHHFAITYHRLLRSKGNDENREFHHSKPGTD